MLILAMSLSGSLIFFAIVLCAVVLGKRQTEEKQVKPEHTVHPSRRNHSFPKNSAQHNGKEYQTSAK